MNLLTRLPARCHVYDPAKHIHKGFDLITDDFNLEITKYAEENRISIRILSSNEDINNLKFEGNLTDELFISDCEPYTLVIRFFPPANENLPVAPLGLLTLYEERLITALCYVEEQK
eukprot:TRINITY_DN6669_c0_g1_i2.p2 TRINITY_DN6669_c0_g1~~TRINITY_DN6669_c0_g1_i2.p2  ORF type:complete len:117 (-),score=15.86 TRINITY_DN6669_c0_g1_i2:19-369(-)